MASTPSVPSPPAEADLVLVELRRIADLLESRLPASALGSPLKAAPVPLDEEGERMFQALRAWRLERARADGLSPYIVAYDRTLRLIARERPRDLEALGGIPGVGPAKALKYGPELLEVMAEVAAAGG
jgi:ATP-dependent DNA helicase RecQ